MNQLHLLQQLYGTVLIPEAVYQELTDPDFLVAGAKEVQTFTWIQIRAVEDRTMVKALSSELDPGEAEAIVLALEMKAEQVLIDERRGRIIAAKLNLHYTGILGVLVEAKSQGFISTVKPLLIRSSNRGFISTVKPLLDDLINKAGFWVAEPLYKSVLLLVNETK
ncbi:MAG: DUF3368 domain-containing protein [Dolichospermum sp.]